MKMILNFSECIISFSRYVYCVLSSLAMKWILTKVLQLPLRVI
mgnify:CR=1 FL=1